MRLSLIAIKFVKIAKLFSQPVGIAYLYSRCAGVVAAVSCNFLYVDKTVVAAAFYIDVALFELVLDANITLEANIHVVQRAFYIIVSVKIFGGKRQCRVAAVRILGRKDARAAGYLVSR